MAPGVLMEFQQILASNPVEIRRILPSLSPNEFGENFAPNRHVGLTKHVGCVEVIGGRRFPQIFHRFAVGIKTSVAPLPILVDFHIFSHAGARQRLLEHGFVVFLAFRNGAFCGHVDSPGRVGVRLRLGFWLGLSGDYKALQALFNIFSAFCRSCDRLSAPEFAANLANPAE